MTPIMHRLQRFVARCARPAAGALALTFLVFAAPVVAESESSDLDEKTRSALLRAVEDERNAHAFYSAVIERHGQTMPFSKIVVAEARHEDELIAICKQHGVEVPDAATTAMTVPESLKDACVAAVKAEKENVAMYDGFLEFVTDEGVRTTFTRLRTASNDRHIPAFTRCVDNDGKYPPRAGAAGACPGGCAMPGCGCGSAAAKGQTQGKAARPGGCRCGQRAK